MTIKWKQAEHELQDIAKFNAVREDEPDNHYWRWYCSCGIVGGRRPSEGQERLHQTREPMEGSPMMDEESADHVFVVTGTNVYIVDDLFGGVIGISEEQFIQLMAAELADRPALLSAWRKEGRDDD